MLRAPLLPALVLTVLAAGGCAQSDGYPSLAPRPAELSGVGPPPAPAPSAIADDAALAARIAELKTQAERGQEAFDREAGRIATTVARAGTSGSESWIEAQQAISWLESVREPTVAALAELDQLMRSRAEVATSDADRAALAAAIDEVGRIADLQRQEIARLTSSLG